MEKKIIKPVWLKYEDYITKFEGCGCCPESLLRRMNWINFEQLEYHLKELRFGDKLAEDLIKWRQILTKFNAVEQGR